MLGDSIKERFTSKLPPAELMLLTGMLTFDPAQRLTAEQALRQEGWQSDSIDTESIALEDKRDPNECSDEAGVGKTGAAGVPA